jgi:uncharacterized protein YrrD
MDIPINAKVFCQDEPCGHTQAVILNPVSDVVTHIVVKESKAPHTQRLVPIDMIDASLTDKVHLKCGETELNDLPVFFDVEYIQADVPHYMQAFDMYYLEPVVVPEKKMAVEKHFHIPRNELAVNRGTSVYSADGYIIGKVDEFLIDQDGGHVTHLILREGHLWGQKDVFIPVGDIDKVKESRVRLKLDKDKIEKLPVIPIKRLWP